jgi:RecB family exonuclease
VLEVLEGAGEGRLSFSRLLTYLTCPRKYYYRYVQRIGEADVTPSLLLGTATHSFLEVMLRERVDAQEAAARVVREYVEEVCQLPVQLAELLYEVSWGYSELLARALPGYVGPDAIRNGDGTVPTDVLSYPSTSWRAEVRRHGELMRRRGELDRLAGEANPLFRVHSCTDLFAQAWAFARVFQVPEWVARTEGVELELAEVPLRPGLEAAKWVGVIDWVVRTKDGRTCLVDHKTGRSLPASVDVQYHPQLAVYAYMWAYHHDGLLPELVAIHHVRSGRFCVVSVERDWVEETVEYFAHLYEASLVGLPHRHLPTEYNSPCVRRHYKTQALAQVCPYLERCWPAYYRRLLEEETFVPGYSLEVNHGA